jgi:type I restriction-modification system DNA methylase subunit
MVVMSPSLPRMSLSASNDGLARRCLRICRYRDDLVRDDAPLPGERQGLVGFAHRPLDTRSACVAVLPAGPSDDVVACRDIGASLFFVADNDRWNVWSQTREQPIHRRTLKTSEVENYFRQHRDQFAPGAIFRAKSWQRAGEGQQLDFVDADLLPMLEREAGQRLRNLFERMVATTMDFLDWKSVPDNDDEAHWLTKTNFWLLAAKLLHDKRVPRFINLDFGDVRTVFARIAYHYDRNNPNPPKINGRLRALQEAARLVAAPPHFRNISAETLGLLYEEALISPTTRKLLGTHRTPTYLVDYMLARLGGWIEELGHKRCHIFEPACGHAPFLSGALRLVSDMLPASIADDPKERHEFLKDHLRGCDRDPFALEIARLSLTLADIPNENGWVLNDGDMFAGSTLANETKSASVVLANPPFENELAAKFLQHTVPALQPGAIFGFVLPVNELTGAACGDVRRQLLAECEIKEISVFPDRMFKFASVETGIVLGRKHEAKKATVATGIRFRRVRESKMMDFRERYDDSWRDMVDAEWLVTKNDARLVVPDLRRIWDFTRSNKTFVQLAGIGQGFSHKSGIPEAEIISSAENKGWIEGFTGIEGSPDTHLLPETKWLNLSKMKILRPRHGISSGVPQVLLNYAPVDRDVWRLKAFIDSVGRPATSRLLLVRPKRDALSLNCLWALCNSPFSNAYTHARASKRDITAGLMRDMPVPDLNSFDLSRLESATRAYLEAAKEFTATYQQSSPKTKPRIANKKSVKATANDQMHLGLPGQPSDGEIAVAKERLRALHWRVDAEVLRLYALPPVLERELLNAFDGVPRVAVPFEQTRYIPREFRDVLTLDEFLRITDEWDATEARRCKLIEKRIDTGSRTGEEEKEFRQLQRLLMLHRRLYAPLPTAEIKALTKQIKEEREWAPA